MEATHQVGGTIIERHSADDEAVSLNLKHQGSLPHRQIIRRRGAPELTLDPEDVGSLRWPRHPSKHVGRGSRGALDLASTPTAVGSFRHRYGSGADAALHNHIREK